MPLIKLHSHFWETITALGEFMKQLTTQELTNMRTAQTDFFNDECDIITNVVTADSFGDETLTPTTHATIECGITFLTAGEGRSADDGRTEVVYDAIIRLPLSLGFSIDMHTQYVINDKAGIVIARTFRPVAPPEVGVSAMNIKLKEVTH